MLSITELLNSKHQMERLQIPQYRWFGEGGCLELSEMESGRWRDCC